MTARSKVEYRPRGVAVRDPPTEQLPGPISARPTCLLCRTGDRQGPPDDLAPASSPRRESSAPGRE